MTIGEQNKTIRVSTDELLKKEAHKNTLGALVNPLKRSDHKIAGLLYLVTYFTHLYFVIFHYDYYLEHMGWFHMIPGGLAIFVTCSALRNFWFLPKTTDNGGMFAADRTFSYGFLVENLWFQIMLFNFWLQTFPAYASVVTPPVHTFIMLWIYGIRELFPKTSYVSWKQGNEKVNKERKRMDELRVAFINLNVVLVRLNFVLKKVIAMYCTCVVSAEYFHGVPRGFYADRTLYQFFTLQIMDAQWNVTAAFFLQTLKFKGFISAEVFSVLFNATPIAMFIVMIWFCTVHYFVFPILLMAFADSFINLKFIYPSSLSLGWKNRIQVAVKTLGVLAVVVLPKFLRNGDEPYYAWSNKPLNDSGNYW